MQRSTTLTPAYRGIRKPSPPLLLTPVGVGAVCFVVALAVSAVVRHQVGFSGDEPYYARIADHPPGPHNFPYAFRIGVPYLVHVLPFSHGFSWKLLALVASAVAAGALCALLREFDVSAELAAGLSAGFVISPPLLVVYLRNGIEVDPAAIMIIMLGSLFIVRRQRIALGIVLLAGTTVHESCLFLIPFAYAVWARWLIDLDALRDLLVVAALPILVYVYLRTSIVAVGEVYQPGYTGGVISARVDVLRDALGHGGWRQEIRRMALAYGPLWLAAPFALPKLPFARRGLVLFVLCLGSMTFALDWGRMVFFAAPVIYVSAAYVLKDRRRLAVLAVVGLLAVDAGYAIYMQVHGVTHGLDSTAPPARGPVT
jgi:hypothetical protein